MEQTVAERPFSQEQQINQQQTWRDGTVDPSDAKFQEGPSQSWCRRNQTEWSRTHMQPSGGYGRDNQTQDTGRVPVCWSFFRGRCFRGTSCRYQHCEFGRRDELRFVLCNDFLKGRCAYGASCKFQHSESDKHVMTSSRSYGSGNLGNVANSGTSQFGEENRDDLRSRSFSREYRSRSPCRKFQIGMCQHGESCPYLHSENTAFARPRYDLSSKLQQGVATTSRNPGFGEGNIGSAIEISQDHDEANKGNHLSRSRSPCCKFLRGRCHRGPSCPYLHPEGNIGSTIRISQDHDEANKGDHLSRSRSPCCKFLRGGCHRGPICPYLHPEQTAYVGPRYDWSTRNHQGLATTSENPRFREGGICTIRSTRGLFTAENSMNFSPMSGSEKTGLAVLGDEIGDCIDTLSNGHQIGDQQTPINAFSNGQGLNLGIINQYGQLMGEYSKLDDELWFSKSEDDEAVTGFDEGPQWNCISAGYVSKYKS